MEGRAMTDSLHAQMCDQTLAERLGNKSVTVFDVSGITSYDDIRRLQAMCDAQNRTVTWTHRRNGGTAVLEVQP
jgi:hypothetical protein